MKSPKTDYKALVVSDCDVKAFGNTPRQRLKRQLSRLGMVEVSDVNHADLIVSAKCVFGASTLSALTDAPNGMLLLDNEGRVAAARCTDDIQSNSKLAELVGDGGQSGDYPAKTGAELAGRYDKKLRKRTDPMVLRAVSRVEVERALFEASYKGVTDFVTKHVWPAPALVVTRWCAARNISPNQVTWVSAVLVVLTFWLFWTGSFALGLIAAWAMTFLDTVDGKLARVTLSSSRFGDVLDHGIDLIHPPFWWWAWAVGCAAQGMPLADGGLVLGAILIGYVLQRVEEGIFIARFGIEMHIWRPFDSFFRQITARRNPNLVILTLALLLGAPREGLIIVAVWTVICLMVHLLQIVQASLKAREAPLTSWLAED